MAETALQSAKSIVQNQPVGGSITAPQGNALSWKDVEAKKEYQDLIPENKAAAKQQYFDMIVAPQIPEAQQGMIRQQFIDYTKRLENERQRPGFTRQMFADSLKIGKRGAGIAVGAFAAIPAFGLGGMTERYLDKEKFARRFVEYELDGSRAFIGDDPGKAAGNVEKPGAMTRFEKER